MKTRKYTLDGLAEEHKPMILSPLFWVILDIILLFTAIKAFGDNFFQGLLMILIFAGVFYLSTKRIKKWLDKRYLFSVLSSVVENEGLYVQKKKDSKDTPRVFIENTKDKLYLHFKLPNGLPAEKVMNAGGLISEGFNFRLVKTSKKFNKVTMEFLKQEVKANIDYIYQNDDGKLKLGFDDNSLMILWDFLKQPHLGIFAKAGSGKSTFVRAIAYQIAKIFGKDNIRFVDFKQVEFGSLKRFGYKVATNVEDFLKVLNDFHELMEFQNEKIASMGKTDFRKAGFHPQFLLIDEFASLTEAFPDDKEGIGDIARRGRSIGFNLIIITQRPDTKFLPGEIRMNLAKSVVMKGGDSDTRRMAFGESFNEFDDLEIGSFLVNDENEKIIIGKSPFYDDEPFLNDMSELSA